NVRRFLVWLLPFMSEPVPSWHRIPVPIPSAQSVVPGQTVSIRCKASSGVSDDIAWYPGPNLLIHDATSRQSGVSGRFTGSQSGADFTLTISGVQAEDAGVYHCQQHHNYPLTHKSNLNLIYFMLGPSSEELKQGKATLMCLANKGFPSDWSLSWKVDGSGSISWEESRSPVVQENDGLYSWSSTLRLPADRWVKVGSVTCEATQGSHTLVSEPLRRDQCSQS
uniref:Ig-like domain-containing protein n=1 Tax=Oreochromis niloticus TaxID=8128 RepID=A0A669DG04_ORENI